MKFYCKIEGCGKAAVSLNPNRCADHAPCEFEQAQRKLIHDAEVTAAAEKARFWSHVPTDRDYAKR